MIFITGKIAGVLVRPMLLPASTEPVIFITGKAQAQFAMMRNGSIASTEPVIFITGKMDAAAQAVHLDRASTEPVIFITGKTSSAVPLSSAPESLQRSR